MRRHRLWLLVALLCAAGLAGAEQPLLVRANGLFEGRALLTIEGKQRLLRAGEVSPEGVRLVSASAKEAVIEIDGRRERLTLSRDVGGRFLEPERREVAVSRNPGGDYRVAGSINGRQLMFMVDTGANVVALSGAEAERLGIDVRREGQPAVVQTAAGPVSAWSVMLGRVEVSGILVRNVPATVIEGDHPSPALLGMSWLRQVGLREEAGVLYLRQR
ncbi:MAG: TIGR02281 family clan AA aspartic protease [Gammaproteobacteria bacterium]